MDCVRGASIRDTANFSNGFLASVLSVSLHLTGETETRGIPAVYLAVGNGVEFCSDDGILYRKSAESADAACASIHAARCRNGAGTAENRGSRRLFCSVFKGNIWQK